MRIRIVFAGLSLIVSAGLIAGPSGESVASTGGETTQDRYRADYLESEAGFAVSSSGEDQCGLPVDERTGPWVCPEDGQAQSESSELAASPNCTLEGNCWFVQSDYQASNSTSGAFGYGSEKLGDVTYTAGHNLNGAQMVSKLTFDVYGTRITDVTAEGDLFHGSSSTAGVPTDGQYDITVTPYVAKETTWRPWDYTGYKSYDKSFLNHANVVQISWSKPDYIGYWFVYMKSVIADDPNDNDIYGFNTSSFRFNDSAEAGYRAG